MHIIVRCIISSFIFFALSSHAADLLSFPPMERVEKRRVLRLEVSPNDEFLLALLSDRSLRLFDLRGEKPIQVHEFVGNPYFQQEDERYEYAFSKDGEKLAVSYKEKVEVYKLKPAFSLEMSFHNSWHGMVTAISFTHDAQSIVIAMSYKMLSIVELATKKVSFSRRLSSKIHGMASLTDNSIVTISQETPMIWRFSDDYQRLLGNRLLEFYELPSVKVASSSDGKTIYIEDRALGFVTYDATSTQIIGHGLSAEVQDSGMTISHDGSLAALSCLNDINIYSAREKSKLIKEIRHSSNPYRMAFSKKNNNLLYIAEDDKIEIHSIDQ